MFLIKPDKTICITRGDAASITFNPKSRDTGVAYRFKDGDVIRFKICKKNDYSTVVLQKDVIPIAGETSVTISLTKTNTRIGDIINQPVDYWYEIELNPDTNPDTLIGHDEAGAKIFRLFPEGGDAK